MNKIYNAEKRLSAQARRAVLDIIQIHEDHRNDYFRSPQGSASGRRSAEKRFYQRLPKVDGIQTKKGLITWSLDYSESCSNCYYSAGFYLNGKTKNVSLLKNLVK